MDGWEMIKQYKRNGMNDFVAAALDVVKNDPKATKEIYDASHYYEEQQELNNKLLKELHDSIDRNHQETMNSINKKLNQANVIGINIARGF